MGKKKEKSKKTLSKISDFDPQEYLNKYLLFNLNKTSEEQIFYGIIKKLPTNDKYYIEHREVTNYFRIRNNEKQGEKDNIIKVIKELDLNKQTKKNKSTNKSKISQLKQTRKEMLNRYSDLGETFVHINDEQTKNLDELFVFERKLASRKKKTGELPSLKKNVAS